ncbi:hypothetical protein ABZ611_13565 [Streptomyces sp. NPDC007861]|uniref:hypothetical protein n=1 Tax=Streptomyces sp. NPDC007861 TaxID=3154893 RepID=UPI00340CCD38
MAEDPTPEPTISETAAPEDVNTAPPADPEEDVTDAPEADFQPPQETDGPNYPYPPKPTDGTDAEYCGPSRGMYLATSKGSQYHRAVGPTNSNYNGTSRTARSTFTSEVTGEVGVSIEGTLKVSTNVMIAEIEGSYAVNLSAKLTAKLGNTIAVDTPPRKTTHAKYGVWRLKNTGKSYTLYSNCTTSAKTTVTSYTPYRVGWYLWES